jgi:hypothetical protein
LFGKAKPRVGVEQRAPRVERHDGDRLPSVVVARDKSADERLNAERSKNTVSATMRSGWGYGRGWSNTRSKIVNHEIVGGLP